MPTITIPVEIAARESDEQWEQLNTSGLGLARQGRITSSLVPQILGVSRWGGPHSAWASITGRKGRGESSEPAELGQPELTDEPPA